MYANVLAERFGLAGCTDVCIYGFVCICMLTFLEDVLGLGDDGDCHLLLLQMMLIVLALQML